LSQKKQQKVKDLLKTRLKLKYSNVAKVFSSLQWFVGIWVGQMGFISAA
jgi:hypothetical protein